MLINKLKKMAAVVADDRLSAYRIHRSIGRGSYGEVFLVTHRGDSKQVSNLRLWMIASRLLSSQHAVCHEKHKING